MVPERVQGLVDVLLLGADVDEHQGLAVASQAVLEEVGELGVPIGDVGVLLGEGHDDVAEVGEGLVDVLGLGQPQSFTAAILDSLTPGEINLNDKMK